MADTIKSVLLVDYDSIYRSLKSIDLEAAERLGERVAEWVAAIEAGRLIGPGPSGPVRRRILVRRCYADPKGFAATRPGFTSNGFEIVDCPAAEGRERSTADVPMTVDTLDAMDNADSSDEFILLSAEADLSPVLARLRGRRRSTVIYATKATTAAYRALADRALEEGALAAFLLGEQTAAQAAALAPSPVAAPEVQAQPAPPAPAVQPTPAAPPAPVSASERGEIEALARKISSATNVPLLSPRTFGELFKVLTEEISKNGYHFQATAENVAAKLASQGRHVTRRQVVFVVKGLALKGHVFSTTDTPLKLAEVFREQVHYLCGNAELTLDEREKSLITAWIVDRAAITATAPEPEPKLTDLDIAALIEGDGQPRPAKRRAPKPPERPARSAPPPPKPAAAQSRPAPKQPPAPQKPAPAMARPEPRKAPPPEPKRSVAETKAAEFARSTPPARPQPQQAPPARPSAAPTPAALAASVANKAAAAAPQKSPSPSPSASASSSSSAIRMPPPAPRPAPEARPPVPEAAKPAPEPAKPAAPEPPAKPSPLTTRPPPVVFNRPSPAALSLKAAASAARPAPAAPARPTPPPPPKPSAAEVQKDSIESSILAAIAQAVDVLVESGGPSGEADEDAAPAPAAKAAPAPAAKAAPARQPEAPTEPPPDPPASEGGDSDDIGDEIQRILASYSRNRQNPSG